MSHVYNLHKISPSIGDQKDFTVAARTQLGKGALSNVLLIPPPGSSPFDGKMIENQWQRIATYLAKGGCDVVCMVPPGKTGHFEFDKESKEFPIGNGKDCGKFTFSAYAQNILDTLFRYEKYGLKHMSVVTSSLGQIAMLLALGKKQAHEMKRTVLVGAPIGDLRYVLQENKQKIMPQAVDHVPDIAIIQGYAERNDLIIDPDLLESELGDKEITNITLHDIVDKIDLGVYGNERDLYFPTQYRELITGAQQYLFKNEFVPSDPFFHQFTQGSADLSLDLIARFFETGTFEEKNTKNGLFSGFFS